MDEEKEESQASKARDAALQISPKFVDDRFDVREVTENPVAQHKDMGQDENHEDRSKHSHRFLDSPQVKDNESKDEKHFE